MTEETYSYIGRVVVSIYCKETKKEITKSFETNYFNSNPEIDEKAIVRKIAKKALSEQKEVKV